MRFLVDAQLPPALARWLAGRGHQAEHVADHGLLQADDRTIWDFTEAARAVIVTKDEDFATRRVLEEGPAIVWVRLGNTRRQELLLWFECRITQIVQSLERGEVLVEVA